TRSLDGLTSETGERLYSSYTFTDISTLFFEPARERFKEYEAIEFRKLDISLDPRDQGFEPESYDLILASNVLHATPDLVQTLRHCRMLLKPDGYLYLQELSQPGKFIQFIVGLFPGWWLGDDDGRPGGPCVPPMEWDRRLRQAGFDGVHTVAYDNEPPYYYTANMLARPAETVADDRRIILLSQSEKPTALGLSVKDALIKHGFQVEQQHWGSNLPKGQDIISLVDIERSTPLLQDITQEDLAYFKQTLQDMSDATILWTMPPAQVNCQNPHCGQMLGAAKCLRVELGLDLTTLELETTTNYKETASAITQVFQKIQRARALKSGSNLDTTYIWTAGQIHIGRFYRAQTTSDLAATKLAKDDSMSNARQDLGPVLGIHPLAPRDSAPLLKPDASYLLVGELTNLCRAAASWMATVGAKDVIVLSASGGEYDLDQAFVDSLKEAGCVLRCFAGDVADREFVQGVIAQNQRCVAGVIQMATVPQGRGFADADHASWTTALRPKIEGTWTLHQLLPIDLDFFVLASTDNGMLSWQRQSNIASANSFLDSFSEYRNGLGLPASVLHINGIAESGLTDAEPDFLRGLQLAVARSAGAIQTNVSAVTHWHHARRRLDQIILANHTHLTAQPPSAATRHCDARIAVYHNNHITRVTTDKSGSGENIQAVSAA
ncbi:KR-domain-containing protein, partial [Colletotrichum somersetense]